MDTITDAKYHLVHFNLMTIILRKQDETVPMVINSFYDRQIPVDHHCRDSKGNLHLEKIIKHKKLYHHSTIKFFYSNI